MVQNNPFFEELRKIASVTTNEGDTMNPDPISKVDPQEVEEVKVDSLLKNEEKKASEQEEMREVIAAALPEFGALAKILEYTQGGESVPEDLQKLAQERLDILLTDEDGYVEVIEKTASELFSTEDNLNELHSEAGQAFVFEQLSSFLENEELEKQANDNGTFVGKVREIASNFVNSIKSMHENSQNLDNIQSELVQAQNELEQVRTQATQDVMTQGFSPLEPKVVQLDEGVDALKSQVHSGQLGKGLKWAGGAGAAALAGKGIYDAVQHFREPQPTEEEVVAEQLASEMQEDVEKTAKVLSDGTGDDTLKTELKNETYGGNDKMSKELVRDFLKIAGAGGLVTIANDEGVDIELRKLASDRFDSIAQLGKTAMGEEFVKVAQEIYSEDQLHEIVAGHHTEELLQKVAFFTEEVSEMSLEDLEKVAGTNSGGVAAKGVAGALTDSKKNIEVTIDTEKKKAEGQGRGYVGDTATSGKVGGQLIGGTEGYNVINNPEKYDVEKTAQSLEEAVLVKQAAAETYFKADQYIRQFGVQK